VGDAEGALAQSAPMMLDPLAGHDDAVRRIDTPDARETLKDLALLDGAFVVTDEGVAVSAARYLDADASELEMPMGLGSRHRAAALSRATDAVTVVASESAILRLIDSGILVAEIIPGSGS